MGLPENLPEWMSPLAYAEEVTAQQIFDDAWEHWVVKGSPVSGDPGWCVYRYHDENTGEACNACAVGRLLIDTEVPDGNPEVASLVSHALLPSRLAHFPGLLADLQGMHDRSARRGGHVAISREEDIGLREDRMRLIAEDYRLEVPADA